MTTKKLNRKLKKKLEAIIEELELENAVLKMERYMYFIPVYIYLYKDVPYNPQLEPYKITGEYKPSTTWIDSVPLIETTVGMISPANKNEFIALTYDYVC